MDGVPSNNLPDKPCKLDIVVLYLLAAVQYYLHTRRVDALASAGRRVLSVCSQQNND